MAGLERIEKHSARTLLEQVTAQTVGALRASPHADESTQAEMSELVRTLIRTAHGQHSETGTRMVKNLARTES